MRAIPPRFDLLERPGVPGGERGAGLIARGQHAAADQLRAHEPDGLRRPWRDAV